MLDEETDPNQHQLPYEITSEEVFYMYYITVKQSPRYHQMSLEEFWFGADSAPREISGSVSDTRTYCVEEVSERFTGRANVQTIIRKLVAFNEKTKELREAPRHSLYKEFYIPKKSHGLRKIDAPNDELMNALRELKVIFEDDCHALYHTSAFAYIKNRCTIDCVKRHQQNESRWFGKYDLSNFFGSTTLEFAMSMFSMVFPFSEVVKTSEGKTALETALSLAFLDGGLPQGTPISPSITNIMMIPVDFTLANKLHDYNGQRYVYTRYADDFHISSKYTFQFREIEGMIQEVLASFNAPFRINESKTRYGSSAGRNWMLGVMLNKDNNVTVGYQNKKHFQRMLENFVMDAKNNIQWDASDVQVMEGLRSYYKMVEGETIDRIVAHVNQKFGVRVESMIKKALR